MSFKTFYGSFFMRHFIVPTRYLFQTNPFKPQISKPVMIWLENMLKVVGRHKTSAADILCFPTTCSKEIDLYGYLPYIIAGG